MKVLPILKYGSILVVVIFLSILYYSFRHQHTMNKTAKVPKSEIDSLSRELMNGDSSNKYCILVNHYALANDDINTARFWGEIAAENGVRDAQYIMASDLIDETWNDEQIRAIFWLEKARMGGDNRASSRIDDLKIRYPQLLKIINDAKKWDQPLESLILMNPDDIHAIKQIALCGNRKAALGLSFYYLYSDCKSSEYEKWLKISAQNGSLYGRQMLANYLSQKPDVMDQLRGQFWLKYPKIHMAPDENPQ